MSKRTHWSGGAVLLTALFGGQAGIAQAQFNFNPNVNPGFMSGLNQAQYMALLQQSAAARAAAQAQSLFPGAAGVNPYAAVAANPYAATMANPYSAAGPYGSAYGSPYDTTNYNPYAAYASGAGSILYGQADVIRAYGSALNSQEQSRILRESALQAQLETRKKRFDLEMYIKANTPTFTEEQAKIAKMTLRRIQTNSSEPEIANGKALNLLLSDMAKYPGKKSAVEPLPLGDTVMAHLNVSKGGYSLGVLRNGGDFTWPIALQEIFPPEQLRLISHQAKALVSSAERGKIDTNVLKDMRVEVAKVRDQLFRKLNEIPTTQYLDAKRFLNDFEDARIALERGEAATQVNFQKWATGGKDLQKLVDYMVSNGLRFTPATQGDEFAYRAVYNGMAAMDVALNGLNGTSPSEAPVDPKANP